MTETKNNKSGIKKALSVIGTVLTVLVLICTAFILISAVVYRVQNKPVKFFGYSFAVVLTGSMEPEIMTGDLIIFKSCDFTDVQVGDDIVFTAGDGFGTLKGQSVVHRVIELVEGSDTSDSAVVGFKTKGVNNTSPDKDTVTEDNLLGICVFNSAFLGGLVTFFSKYGVVIIILLIALPFIVKQIIKIVKLSKESDGDKNNENKQ